MAIFYAEPMAAARNGARMLLLLFLLLFSTRTFAGEGTELIPLSLDERVKQASVIVEGEVVSQQSFWDTRHENIYTSNSIKVYKVFKGQLQAQQIEVITEGGAVGLKMHVFSTALKLNKGQQGLFFLQREQELRSTPAANGAFTGRAYGSQQGFVAYDMAQHTAADVFNTYSSVQELYQAVAAKTGNSYRTVADNSRLRQARQQEQQTKQQQPLLVPVITGFSPQVASAGTSTVLTINGTNFGNTRGKGFVEFRNADDGGQTFVTPLPSDYISWTNSQIRLRIPSSGSDGGTAGSGEIRVTSSDGTTSSSATKLIIEFAYSAVNFNGRAFQPILTDQNGSGGYTVQYAPSMLSVNAAQEGFRRALNSWICTTTVNWEIGAPTTLEKAAEDNVNVIRFAPSSTTGAGVLARTISRYEGCGTSTDTLFWVSEFDMEINSNISWQYGPGPPVSRQYDFQTVMLHELGHAHQLGHVILPRAVMHYAIEFEILVRDLSSADITGANLVMARSLQPNFCQVPAMEAKLDGDCNLAPEIYTFNATFDNGQVKTEWTTRADQNIDYFVVQRSTDGAEWTDVSSQINSLGPNADFQEYTYTDPEPLPRISYYRLRVVYNNQSESFSPRVRVINPAALRQLSIFPSPANRATGYLQLEYIVQSNTTVDMQLYNSAGKMVKNFSANFTDVNLPVRLDIADLASGLYILKWSDRKKEGEVKLLIL